jgi:ABC-type antimicrobial peptide transport system permease subunit
LDPGIAVAGIASMDQLIDNSVAAARFVATLIGAFAMVALLLAAIGIYGVMSNAVAQRTQEIGVRLALGAGEGQIFTLVVGQSLRLAALGLTLGLAGSLAAGQALKSLLFGVGGADPATIGGTAAILVAVALLAAYVPARRAMRIDPMTALRVE